MSKTARSKTGGRTKGTPNKTTRALKDAILNAFEEVGGQSYLATVARSDPRTFCTLLGKLVPAEIRGSVAQGVSHEEALRLLDGPTAAGETPSTRVA